MIKELNSTQRDEVIEQYVNLLIDSMSMEDLISYVSEDLTNFCDKLTDSELDANVIIKQPVLNSIQRDELIEHYTEIVVDNMDMQALIQYAQEQLAEYFDRLSDIELKEDINNYDDNDGLYEELVDNIISNTTPLIDNQGGQS